MFVILPIMELQHNIYLSLGTNLGNKTDNLQKCILSIHQFVGTVIKVSSIYQTPSWGFVGEDFYNCAILIHSHKTPSKILKQVQSIEKEFGREKKESKKIYESRIIDIDIISYDDEIISQDSLTVPHHLMHERNFVLFPLKEIEPNWIHPIKKISVEELISEKNDKSQIFKIGNLENPIENYRFTQLNYLTIEGNIGAGKTTLAQKIAQDFNGKLILERFADNPFLPKFYNDQKRYAFPLEMSFLADRYQQLTDDVSQFDLFKDFIIADYHMIKSSIFAKITLQEEEFKLYKTMFDIIYKDMPKPDLYIYLYQNAEKLLENIKKRGRNYEKNISVLYLNQINKGYLEFIKQQKSFNILVIDISERDFVKNQVDYIYILDLIQEKIGLSNQLIND